MKHWFKMALAGAVLAIGTAANAATVQVWNDTQYDVPANSSGYRGDVNCNACEVLTYSPTTFSFSASLGELFKGPANSGDASEAAWVNLVLGTSFTTANVTAGKVSTGIADAFNYVTNALYVVIKIGQNPDYTIIKNTSGGALTWSWTGKPGQGAGLSHYIALGTVAPVPVPAAGLLLLTALGGLTLARRRKSV